MELVIPKWWLGGRVWRTSCGMEWTLQPLAFYAEGRALMLLSPRQAPYEVRGPGSV
jgi:hypothetical protein